MTRLLQGRAREAAFLAFAILVAIVSVGGTLWVFLGDTEGDSTGAKVGEAPIARDFRPPDEYDLTTLGGDRPFACDRDDVECARRYLRGITDDYGPRASLGLLARLKGDGRIALGLDDHNLAHVVGRRAAERFGANVQAFGLCPNTFNYGCPHGFFEEVLGRAGTPKAAAGLICESLASSANGTARFSCYHGVGHGVMMAEAYDLDRSLATCDSLGDSTAQEGCWQGVFMENVNAELRDEAREGVFSVADPLAPCDAVVDRYRHQCFINHAGWLLHAAGSDIGRASRLCLDAPARYVSACVQSLGLMVTNPVWQLALLKGGRPAFSEAAWSLCTQFPEASQVDCVIAGVDNLANFDRLDIDRSRSFCSVVRPTLREACFRRIGLNLERQSKDPEVLTARCGSLPSRYVQGCREGARLGLRPGPKDATGTRTSSEQP